MKIEYRINDECVKCMLVWAYTCTDTYMQICPLISLLVVTNTNKTPKNGKSSLIQVLTCLQQTRMI